MSCEVAAQDVERCAVAVERACPPLGCLSAKADENGATMDSSPSSWTHPHSFYCPISQQCMHDPVVLSDGHSYERRHIERWLEDHSTSPVSGLQLSQTDIFPNHALRNAIEEYFEQIFSVHRRAIRRSILRPDAQESLDSNAPLLRTIDALMQCALLVNADLTIECVLRQIVDEAKALVGAEAASVFLVDDLGRALYSRVNSTGGELRIPITAGIAGHVATTGEPVIIQDAYSDSRFDKTVDKKTGFTTRNIMCVPLKVKKDQVIGVVQLINKRGPNMLSAEDAKTKSYKNTFTADDLQFLQVFASQAATAVANRNACEAAELVCETVMEMPADSSCPKRVDASDGRATAMLDEAFDAWELDTLALAEVTGNRPLSTLATYLFKRLGLVEHFDLDQEKLSNFFAEIEQGYDDMVLYHNRSHAASVLYATHALLWHGRLLTTVAPALQGKDASVDADGRLEHMACLIAAAAHDFEHRGLNNDFLVRTLDGRALRHNNLHVNEQHHVSGTFVVLLKPHCNFLVNLAPKQFLRLRSLIIDLVFATDMGNNSRILKAFCDKTAKGTTEHSEPAAAEAGSMCEEQPAFIPNSAEDAVLLLQMVIKCADVGHLAMTWDYHMKWVRRLEMEFFAQGDKEKALGLRPVSFLMDRDKPGVSQTQVGFLEFVALPLFRALAQGLPASRPMLAGVTDNYMRWKTLESARIADQHD